MGLFVKVSDQDRGAILENGSITKTFTARDRERIRYGRSVNEKDPRQGRMRSPVNLPYHLTWAILGRQLR